jgi:hypothetical protein
VSAPADALTVRVIAVLAVLSGLMLHGRSRATAADRKRIAKYNLLPERKCRLEFSFWGHELRAAALGEPPSEEEALAVAKFFWFTRNDPRPDCGKHAAISFRNAAGRSLFSVGVARLDSDGPHKRSLYVFGDPLRPVAPMKSAPVESVRDL